MQMFGEEILNGRRTTNVKSSQARLWYGCTRRFAWKTICHLGTCNLSGRNQAQPMHIFALFASLVHVILGLCRSKTWNRYSLIANIIILFRQKGSSDRPTDHQRDLFSWRRYTSWSLMRPNECTQSIACDNIWTKYNTSPVSIWAVLSISSTETVFLKLYLRHRQAPS